MKISLRLVTIVAAVCGFLLGSSDAWAQQSGSLLNISTRARTTNEEPLIGGFILRAPARVTDVTPGPATKRVILRALGPSMIQQGVPGTVRDPFLALGDGTLGLQQYNNNWKDSDEARIRATTIPPLNDLESAIVADLSEGGYTGIVTPLADPNTPNPTGIALVEVYDLDPSSSTRLLNVSSRGAVGTGDNVMIGGVIIGNGNLTLLIRAIGPSLSSDLGNSLTDPTLELYDANGNTIGFNDDWMQSQRTEIKATTIPPTDSRESAILKTLPAGNYTAIVRGKNQTTGQALVEFYVIDGGPAVRGK